MVSDLHKYHWKLSKIRNKYWKNFTYPSRVAPPLKASILSLSVSSPALWCEIPSLGEGSGTLGAWTKLGCRRSITRNSGKGSGCGGGRPSVGELSYEYWERQSSPASTLWWFWGFFFFRDIWRKRLRVPKRADLWTLPPRVKIMLSSEWTFLLELEPRVEDENALCHQCIACTWRDRAELKILN